MNNEKEQNQIIKLSHLDPENARSLYNIAPDVVREALIQTPKEVLTLSEEELIEKLDPSYEMSLLRFKFFEEYLSAQTHLRKMSLKNILSGTTTKQYLIQTLLISPEAVAFIVLPPKDYHLMISESMVLGYKKLREVLNMPLYDKQGKPNTAVANTILKTVQILENRVFGPQTQKLDVRQVTQTLAPKISSIPNLANKDQKELNTTTQEVDPSLQEMDLETIEQKIKELKNV